MNNKREDSRVRDTEEIDPGEPIAALARFEHDVSSGLARRIRHTVQWRTNVSQLASFSAAIPLLVLRELWSVLISRPYPKDIRKEDGDGSETS
jgi:hypothetical protein